MELLDAITKIWKDTISVVPAYSDVQYVSWYMNTASWIFDVRNENAILIDNIHRDSDEESKVPKQAELDEFNALLRTWLALAFTVLDGPASRPTHVGINAVSGNLIVVHDLS